MHFISAVRITLHSAGFEPVPVHLALYSQDADSGLLSWKDAVKQIRYGKSWDPLCLGID